MSVLMLTADVGADADMCQKGLVAADEEGHRFFDAVVFAETLVPSLAEALPHCGMDRVVGPSP